HPDAKAGLAVELLPERLALLGRHLQGLAGVSLMNEPARRRRAVRINFLVTGFDFFHLLLAYLGIMQGCRPVGAALKNGEVLRLFGDLRDCLDGGRTGPTMPASLPMKSTGECGHREG